jgi:hypothetical protein
MHRVEGVPLVRTGTYNLSTGTHTFTEEDLAAMLAAANDPGMPAPRIKLGHTDPREGFGGGMDDNADAALSAAWAELDGEPALGWVSDLALSADGQQITGTLNVPEGLAAMMEYAFPNRSIEAWPKITSGTQRVHEWAMLAVSLLGVKLPAVLTLDDLFELHATIGTANASAPVEVPLVASGNVHPVGAQREHDAQPVLATIASAPVTAGLDSYLVGQRFVDLMDEGDDIDDLLPEGAYRYAMWPTSVRFDDGGVAYLKATDEHNGRLYRYDFTVSGAEITFTLAGEVIEQDVLAAALPPERARSPRPALARWGARNESRNLTASHPNHHQEDDRPMNDALRRALATRHGLDPETATEEQIEAAETAAPNAGGTPPEGTSPEGEGSPNTQPTEELEPVAATATIDPTALAQLQADAAAGRAAREAQVRSERDALIQAAMDDGRITPASREEWRRDLDAAPEATERALARLTPTYPGSRNGQGTATASAGNAQDYAAVARTLGVRKPTDLSTNTTGVS